MRSFNILRKAVTRRAPRDTAKLTVNNIKISAPLPMIMVTAPQESAKWGPRDARPMCDFPFFLIADDYSKTFTVRRRPRRAWRGTPIGLLRLQQASSAPETSPETSAPSSKNPTKRHAVGNFAEVIARAATPAKDAVWYREVMQREILGGVELILPTDGVFAVVIPSSSTSRKEFKFGKGMQVEEMYRHLVAYLSNETDRKSPAPMVFVSRTYTEAIYDAESYKAWLTWMKDRDARERILLAV